MKHAVRLAAAALAALALTSCGGGNSPSTPPITAAAAALRTAALPAPQAAAATTVTVSPDALMDWAEQRFPSYFPSHEADSSYGSYLYRFYPGTGFFLGVDSASQSVVVKNLLGPDIVGVGHVIDYACNVAPANCPVLAGVAAKGPLAAAALNVFTVNGDGSKGGLLASATTGTDGRFSVMLPWQWTGPVVLEASGGSYTSAYDGKTVAPQAGMQAMLAGVSATGESGLSVNPLTDMSAALARSYVAGGYSLSSSVATADKWTAWQYGLKSAPVRIVPKFDVTAVNSDAQSVHLALVLAGLDTLSKRLAPANPDALYTALTQDFADGVFDGASGTTRLSLNGTALATDAGTAKFEQAFAVTFSSTAAGLRPAYVDAQFKAGTVVENYQAKIIPVYEAASVAQYFPPAYQSPLPKTTSLDSSATGYSCPVGAPISFGANGQATCGSYYTCYGATLITNGTSVSCSDGGIPIFHAADIAVYTATSIPVYTAPTIQSYTATGVDCYLAQTTIADPAAGTIPIFRASAVHLFTDAERAAMAANDQAAGDAAAAKVSALGIPNDLQMQWLQKINDAVIASVSHY